MNNKYNFFKILLSLICLSNALGGKIHREVKPTASKPVADELDNSTRDESGCKFISLAKGEPVTYTQNSGLAHTTLAALLADQTLVDQNHNNFELHFAVRSASDLHVQLFTRRQFVNTSITKPDFEIVLDSVSRRHSYLTFSSYNAEYMYGSAGYKEFYSADLISSDKYANFFIKLHDKSLLIGKQCERQLLDEEESLGVNAVEFVQFGFQSNSESGAKILYDCPHNFAGCPCSWLYY